MRDWLFRHLFPRQYDHMQHLVDDVIRLEQKRRCNSDLSLNGQATITSGNSDVKSLWIDWTT